MSCVAALVHILGLGDETRERMGMGGGRRGLGGGRNIGNGLRLPCGGRSTVARTCLYYCLTFVPPRLVLTGVIFRKEGISVWELLHAVDRLFIIMHQRHDPGEKKTRKNRV